MQIEREKTRTNKMMWVAINVHEHKAKKYAPSEVVKEIWNTIKKTTNTTNRVQGSKDGEGEWWDEDVMLDLIMMSQKDGVVVFEGVLGQEMVVSLCVKDRPSGLSGSRLSSCWTTRPHKLAVTAPSLAFFMASSSSSPSTPQPRVVVIGCGPTGLGAAWRLTELGHQNWRLLEAGHEAGGLARTVVS